ncbi:hypothetical protein P167DRAFT_573514 [Morchella conica CCBAS932]|uniref:Uncharacterized protein n=1 Tax=Morchella conica CCBAS932 TaxID=1392247 RepID=A0A3N4KRI0_9PEZI|nr:hypothetical protein P167DRAFT_573514 [Morchella conica CCBAS932]
MLCQTVGNICIPSPATRSRYFDTPKKVIELSPEQDSLYRSMDKKSIFHHAFESYSIEWRDIRHDSLNFQARHLKDLSELNNERLGRHRMNESPGLRNAHREAYARCCSDKRLKFSLELARQMRKLLKGPWREEYKLRMVGGQGGVLKARSRPVKTRSRSTKAVAVVGRAASWRGRLRPVKEVGNKI